MHVSSIVVTLVASYYHLIKPTEKNLSLILCILSLFAAISPKDVIKAYFSTSYVVLDYDFLLVILFKFTLVGSIFINRYIFSSIKERNWLISKGMCVLLFEVFNLEKLTFSKLVGKVNFSERKLEEMH